jgi:hypothetical protein
MGPRSRHQEQEQEQEELCVHACARMPARAAAHSPVLGQKRHGLYLRPNLHAGGETKAVA